jgi:hypothetical protein
MWIAPPGMGKPSQGMGGSSGRSLSCSKCVAHVAMSLTSTCLLPGARGSGRWILFEIPIRRRYHAVASHTISQEGALSHSGAHAIPSPRHPDACSSDTPHFDKAWRKTRNNEHSRASLTGGSRLETTAVSEIAGSTCQDLPLARYVRYAVKLLAPAASVRTTMIRHAAELDS